MTRQRPTYLPYIKGWQSFEAFRFHSLVEDLLRTLRSSRSWTKRLHRWSLAEHQFDQSVNALERRDLKLAEEVVTSPIAPSTSFSVRSWSRSFPWSRDANPWRSICAISRGLFRSRPSLNALAISPRTSPSARSTIADEPRPKPLMSGIRKMAELALTQLRGVLEAYAERDAEKALAVWRHDAQIDATYNSLFRELLTYMMEDPRNIGMSTHLLFGTKNIERAGDHTTNIAENDPLPRARLQYR